MRVLITSVLFCFLLSACGKGQEEAMPSDSSDSSGGNMSSMEGDSGPDPFANGKTVDGTFYPNHEKDAKEFRVRSSLGGVKRMIETYKEEGVDTSELEAEKAKLKEKLDKMTG